MSRAKKQPQEPLEAPAPDAPEKQHQAWKQRMEEIYVSNCPPVQAQPGEYRELYVMPQAEGEGQTHE